MLITTTGCGGVGLPRLADQKEQRLDDLFRLHAQCDCGGRNGRRVADLVDERGFNLVFVNKALQIGGRQ
ncbi:MAG: hypothetical protein R2911_12340 [Caldilineaceae bacterium]